MTSPQTEPVPGRVLEAIERGERVSRCSRFGHIETTTAKEKTKCPHVFTEDEAEQAASVRDGRGNPKKPGDKCRQPANVPSAIRRAFDEMPSVIRAKAREAAALGAWEAEGPPAHWSEILGEESGGSPCDPEETGCECSGPPIRYLAHHTGEICPECGPECWDISRAAGRRAREHVASVKREATRSGTASAIVPQSELDQAGRALKRKRDQLARLVSAALADSRISAESRSDLEWFAAAIGEAATIARLEDLAAQLAALEIDRRGWWRRPAGVADYEDEEDQQAPAGAVPGEVLSEDQAEDEDLTGAIEALRAQFAGLPGGPAHRAALPAAPVSGGSVLCELCLAAGRQAPAVARIVSSVPSMVPERDVCRGHYQQAAEVIEPMTFASLEVLARYAPAPGIRSIVRAQRAVTG